MAYGGRTYTIQTIAGDVIAGVNVSVYKVGYDALSSIFSDGIGTTLANPVASSVLGVSEFYAVAGVYDVKLSKPGYLDQYLRSVAVVDDALDAELLTLYAVTGFTALDLIKQALENIRVKAPGAALPAAAAIDLLRTLNLMMDSLATFRLMGYQRVNESFALTAGQSFYTIGPNGDLNTLRPESIELSECFLRTGTTDYPLSPMTQQKYAAIGTKSGTNGVPTRIWYDNQSPLGRLQFNCPLSSGYTLYLSSNKGYAEFPTIYTELVFPAGYKAMLSALFTVWIAPSYGKQTPAEVAGIATSLMSHLKAQNAAKSPIMADYSGVPFGRSGSYINKDFERGNF